MTDLLQPIQNVAREAMRQGQIIGRREAFAEAAAIARNYDEAHKQIGELIARKIEQMERGDD